MTPEQAVAYIQAQSTAAKIECIAMQTQNAADINRGAVPTYKHQDIYNLIDKYGISHNAVLGIFQGAS